MESSANHYPNNIDYIEADISKNEDRNLIFNKIEKNHIKFLIHNAAVLNPVGNILNINETDFRYHLSVNLEAPLFLTQLLLPKMTNSSRILNISSGAAYSAIPGWSAYNISKAAFAMLYNVLKNDLSDFDIKIGSVCPGIVDTPMQEYIRSLDNKIFPQIELFKIFKEKNKLLNPEKVAYHLFWLLLHTSNNIYIKKDWDIKEVIEMHDEVVVPA